MIYGDASECGANLFATKEPELNCFVPFLSQQRSVQVLDAMYKSHASKKVESVVSTR